jgi:4-diphosphocytidyl-2-C-methyl-D-erythritol kinase
MLTVTAYAKINLLLDVVAKRPDGYHELSMVMQSVSLADTLLLKKAESIQITTDKDITAKPEDNLVYKAVALLQKDFPSITGAQIHIEKCIPMAAGLAGGSADCAGALVGLNEIFNLGLTRKQLEKYANLLGSDIAFCLHGGTQLCTGRGERLTVLPPLPKLYGLILKPPFPIATPLVYKKIPQGYQGAVSQSKLEVYEDGLITAYSLGNNLSNDLYAFACQVAPEESAYVDLVKRTQPAACQMSGSGPSVFAFYHTQEKRDAAHLALSAYEIYAITTGNLGIF